MYKAIILSDSQKKILINHAKDESPNESSALLFGSIENGNCIVKDIFLTKNTDESPVNFTISNEQLIQGYDIAEKKNLEVVGIFHSHPNSDSNPSATDKKYMQINPVVWVIFSGITNEFKSFVLDSEIVEIPMSNS